MFSSQMYRNALTSAPEELNEAARYEFSSAHSSFTNKIKDLYRVILIYWKSVFFSTAYFVKMDTDDFRATVTYVDYGHMECTPRRNRPLRTVSRKSSSRVHFWHEICFGTDAFCSEQVPLWKSVTPPGTGTVSRGSVHTEEKQRTACTAHAVCMRDLHTPSQSSITTPVSLLC